MRRFLLIITYTLTAWPLFAQQTDSVSGSTRHVDLVTIYGRRTVSSAIPAQTLSGKELKALSANTIADAIRYFSGVQLKDYGGIGGLKTVNIRSMGSQHVGVFYDGIALNNAQNGQIDLGRFSLDNMEAISIHNGQKSSLLQSAQDYASSSTIYMRTRTPRFESGNRNLDIGFKTGSFGTANPSLLWEQRLSDRLSSSVSAEYLYTTGRYKFRYTTLGGYDTTQTRHGGDVSALRAEAGLFGTVKEGQWRAKLYFYNSERGYPGAAVRHEPGKFRHEDRQWDRNIFVQGMFRKRLAERYNILVSGKYANDYLRYLSDPRINESTMYVDNRYHSQEVYLSTAGEAEVFKWWSLNLAADYRYNTMTSDMPLFAYPRRHTLLAAAATSLRFDRLNIQGSVLYTHIKDHTDISGASAGSKDVWSPSVAVRYKPFREHELDIRAFYKSTFRMPTLNDLYYTFIGNKYLKPEHATQYDIGAVYSRRFVRRSFKQLELQADLYYNVVNDKIVAIPASNQFQWTMLNLGRVEIKGLDAMMLTRWLFGKVSMHTRVNYTWQQAQDKTDPSSPYYGGQIPYIPWHSASATLGADFCGWSLSYSFIYTGKRYESVANTPENYAPPWYTHDMSVSKSFTIRRVGMRATAELNNIFNQQYEVVQCYPMPGTNFKIKINVTI